MLVVIQAQSGDLLFGPRHIYLRQDRIHSPKDPLNDKVAPTGTICCDEIIIGKYATAERAQEVITDFYVDCQRNESFPNGGVLTYRMPKE